MKRSQISIYVILGLVIVIIVGFFVFKKDLNDFVPEIPVKNEIEKFDVYVENCLDEHSQETLTTFGKQGSTYPKRYLATKAEKISYYYFLGEEFLPSLDSIKNDIIESLQYKIRSCVNSYFSSELLIEINNDIKINMNFEDDTTTINLQYPIKIYYKGEEEFLKDWSSIIQIDLSEFYEISKKIIKDTTNSPEWINLDNLNHEYLDIKIIKIDKSTILYVIKNEIDNIQLPFEYRFAVKYNL